MPGDTYRPIGGRGIGVVGDDHRHDTSCFADEVVIDFPSVARAVDRIRSSFIGDERSAELAAAIRISPREAREGAAVPLDVPMRCTCRACGGRGESWSGVCDTCAGSGSELVRHQVRVLVPAGVVDGARFRFAVGPRHDLPTRIELHILVT